MPIGHTIALQIPFLIFLLSWINCLCRREYSVRIYIYIIIINLMCDVVSRWSCGVDVRKAKIIIHFYFVSLLFVCLNFGLLFGNWRIMLSEVWRTIIDIVLLRTFNRTCGGNAAMIVALSIFRLLSSFSFHFFLELVILALLRIALPRRWIVQCDRALAIADNELHQFIDVAYPKRDYTTFIEQMAFSCSSCNPCTINRNHDAHLGFTSNVNECFEWDYLRRYYEQAMHRRVSSVFGKNMRDACKLCE